MGASKSSMKTLSDIDQRQRDIIVEAIQVERLIDDDTQDSVDRLRLILKPHIEKRTRYKELFCHELLSKIVERYPKTHDAVKCSIMIEAGVNVNAFGGPQHRCGHGRSPLEEAIGRNNFDVCHLLIDAGATINTIEILGQAASSAVLWTPSSKDVFVEQKTDPTRIRNHITSVDALRHYPHPLLDLIICFDGDWDRDRAIQMFELLITRVDIAEKCKSRLFGHVLYKAVATCTSHDMSEYDHYFGYQDRCFNVLNILLSHMVNVNVRDSTTGGTVLHLLAEKAQFFMFPFDLANYLITRAKVAKEIRDKDERTALELALHRAETYGWTAYGHNVEKKMMHLLHLEKICLLLAPDEIIAKKQIARLRHVLKV